jgi:uncharacterized membrane protein YoaK (UPF0700 family)
MSAVLAIEAALLVAFMFGGHAALRHGPVPTSDGAAFYGLVAIVTIAIGLQTAALQRAGGRVVRTTYVTGMLTRLAEETVVFGFWFPDERRAEGRRRASEWARHIGRRVPAPSAARTVRRLPAR